MPLLHPVTVFSCDSIFTPTYIPDLYAGEAVVVNVVLLQDATPIVVEVDAHLLAAVDPVAPEHWLTAGGDPHTSEGVGVNLVALNDAPTIVMLREWKRTIVSEPSRSNASEVTRF